MESANSKQLTRNDWLEAALRACESGVAEIKISRLATTMGVSTGSFYWHFKDRQDLLQSLLDYWERELTDGAIEAANQYVGSPADRILYLMETVVEGNLARFDLAIWAWAKSDRDALRVFKRAVKKRFAFAAWMFSEAGYSKQQAEIRGRMMVEIMMAESTLIPGGMAERKKSLKIKYKILTAPE